MNKGISLRGDNTKLNRGPRYISFEQPARFGACKRVPLVRQAPLLTQKSTRWIRARVRGGRAFVQDLKFRPLTSYMTVDIILMNFRIRPRATEGFLLATATLQYFVFSIDLTWENGYR